MRQIEQRTTGLRSEGMRLNRAGLCAAALAALLVCGNARADDSTTLSTANGPRYRPGAFLTMDLSKAVLSPIPLGPQARFEPFGIEARGDASDSKLPSTTSHAARTSSKIMAGARIAPRPGEAKPVDVKPSDDKPSETAAAVNPPTDATAEESAAPSAKAKRTAKSGKSATRTRAAANHRPGNPLDAQASARPKARAKAQPKVQTWPCRSGGICGWQN